VRAVSRWAGPFAVCVIAALAAHAGVVFLAPAFIMDRALAQLEARGIALHAFMSPRRISPATQSVVRSSPDLFYALCRYDLSDPAAMLRVTMSAWPDYQSLSFFDAKTNNYLTYRGTGESLSVRIAPPGAHEGEIASPTARGVVLIRRLAPTSDLFARAAETARADRCDLVRANS